MDSNADAKIHEPVKGDAKSYKRGSIAINVGPTNDANASPAATAAAAVALEAANLEPVSEVNVLETENLASLPNQNPVLLQKPRMFRGNSMIMNDRFENLKKRWFGGKRGIRPVFILAYGPPGSGKTSTIKKFLKEEGEDFDNYVTIVLDDIIEQDEEYQRETHALLRQKDISDEDRVAKAQEIYFRHRKNAGLLSEHMLDVAVRQRYNVIFESTGSDNSINWSIYMFRNMMANGYKTWVFYPWVSIDRLLQRVDARGHINGRMIPHDYVRSIFIQAQNNFEAVSVLADAVWFYDNDSDDMSGDYITHFVNLYNETRGRQQKQSCKLTRFPKEIEPKLLAYLRKRCNVG